VDLEDLRRLDPEQAEEEALKMEAARAKERATLKHSAKGGRWARAQYGAGETDGKRREIEEMLSQKERLTRILPRGVYSFPAAPEARQTHRHEQLHRPGPRHHRRPPNRHRCWHRNHDLGFEEETAAQKPTGIFGMKFMQRAMAKDKARVDDEEAELRRQLEEYSDAGLESTFTDVGLAENTIRPGLLATRIDCAASG
jgi:U3 small nucleolar RNA-associated protein 14